MRYTPLRRYDMPRVSRKAFEKERQGIATGKCLCGKVQVEINLPAFWAWHDRSRSTRRPL
mgnify:CR=1 FL=1